MSFERKSRSSTTHQCEVGIDADEDRQLVPRRGERVSPVVDRAADRPAGELDLPVARAALVGTLDDPAEEARSEGAGGLDREPRRPGEQAVAGVQPALLEERARLAAGLGLGIGKRILEREEQLHQAPHALGLVPGEHSSGPTRRQGPITRCGNRWVRSLLIEAAWAYRYTPKVSGIIERRAQNIDPAIRERAWKAQLRLTRKYRRLISRGKHKNVAVTAVARELAAFIWDAARLLQRSPRNA